MTSPFVGLTGTALASQYLDLSESEYAGGLMQPPHGHDPAYVTAVVGGAYEERVAGSTRLVQQGHLLFHPAGEEHAVRFVAPRTRVFRIEPRSEFFAEARLAGAELSSAFRDPSPAVAAIIARMRHSHRRADALAPLTLDGLACELLAAAAGARPGRRAPNRAGAERARAVLEAQLDSPPTLAELAAQANCHPITLARAFRQQFGCSIGAYVRRRRLEFACQMLRSESTPISRVAALAGFADQPHLTRALRRAVGMTPATLRASARANGPAPLRTFKTS